MVGEQQDLKNSFVRSGKEECQVDQFGRIGVAGGLKRLKAFKKIGMLIVLLWKLKKGMTKKSNNSTYCCIYKYFI